MIVHLVWEDRAEKGEDPELVDVYETRDAASRVIDELSDGDEQIAETYNIEERTVKT